jgi:hypothetical protein
VHPQGEGLIAPQLANAESQVRGYFALAKLLCEPLREQFVNAPGVRLRRHSGIGLEGLNSIQQYPAQGR